MEYFCTTCSREFVQGFPQCDCMMKVGIHINIQAETVDKALKALWRVYADIRKNIEKLDLSKVTTFEGSIIHMDAIDVRNLQR